MGVGSTMAGIKFHEAHLLMPYLPSYHQDDNVAFGLSASSLEPILKSVANQIEAKDRDHDCNPRVGSQVGRDQ